MNNLGITLILLCGVVTLVQPAYPTDNIVIITNSSIPVFAEPSICTSSISGNTQHVDCSGGFIQIRSGTLVTEMLQEINTLQGIIDSFVDSLVTLVQAGR